MRYLGRSVRRSAAGAAIRGTGEPGSVTSSTGQGFGFRMQNSRKSKARSFFSTTRLAWTNPLAKPEVGPQFGGGHGSNIHLSLLPDQWNQSNSLGSSVNRVTPPK